jgi:GDP-L-fucose synthase
LDFSSRIYVAGHTGLVGSALVARLRALGYNNLILRTRRELDLTDQAAVERFFSETRPEYVFLAAARVGGILANSSLPAAFIFENLRIQTNVIHECYRSSVKRLLFLGSSCIYPRDAAQPLQEESLLTGPLELTNRPYAVAKIAGIEMCWAYNRQYHTQFLAAMPTNLYGPGDNYDSQSSHLVPALIRKMHEAKAANAQRVVLWGTGTPRRELLYSADAADACVFLMRLPQPEIEPIFSSVETPPLVNVGCGADHTVAEIAELVAEVVNYRGSIAFDPAKPDGTPRKLMDTSRLTALGWKAKTHLHDGLVQAYRDFCSRQFDSSTESVLSSQKG